LYLRLTQLLKETIVATIFSKFIRNK